MTAREIRQVRSIREIPRPCVCKWQASRQVSPAEWTLTEVAPDCQVHGERP